MKHFAILFFIILNLSIKLIFADDDDLFSNERDLFKFERKNPIGLKDVKFGPCNIPIEKEPISQEDFLEKYAFSSPVVFRRSNSSEKNRNSLFKEKCEIENLLREFGDKYVTVSSANTYSYKTYKMRLDEYLAKHVLSFGENEFSKLGNETWYFFGENNITEWKNFFDLYERPKYTLHNHDHAYSFGVAAGFTGVPFHYHGPGFAETLVGRKRWFLYEPSNRPYFNPDKSTLQWFLEEYGNIPPKNMPLECILEPLDIIYFPDRWWHATLNVDNVVFISTFLSPNPKKNL